MMELMYLDLGIKKNHLSLYLYFMISNSHGGHGGETWEVKNEKRNLVENKRRSIRMRLLVRGDR